MPGLVQGTWRWQPEKVGPPGSASAKGPPWSPCPSHKELPRIPISRVFVFDDSKRLSHSDLLYGQVMYVQ